MRRCKQHGKRWCWNCFLATVGFPLEHFLWEDTPLRAVALFLGIH